MSTPPLNFAQMPTGRMLLADGLNPMLRWDGFLAAAEAAGIAAPLTAPTLSSLNNQGTYYSFVRFLDADDNPSNLSPVSNQLGPVSPQTGANPNGTFLFGQVSSSPTAPLVRLTLPNHGITHTYDQLFIQDPVSGGGAIFSTGLAGTWYVQVVDANTLDLLNSNVFTGPGKPKNFAPLSAIWWKNASGAVQVAGTKNKVFYTGHGLSTGEAIQVLDLQGATTPSATLPANFTVTVIDANTFTIDNFTAVGNDGWIIAYTPLAANYTYTNVPVPTDPKVVRRQILRNTDGQTATFYVDVDTADIVSTSFSSANTDAQLQANEAVPILRPDGSLGANRYNVPPSHKLALAHHLGRMFAAGELVYNQGNIQVTNGQTTVQGVGTAWPASLVGRFLYVKGAAKPYQIDAVNTTAQTLTLDTAYADSTDLFAVYGIRPAPAERRLVYYSEPGFPEAWPPTNALELQEDQDEITGLMQKGAYLYILERSHVYRFTFQSDPGLDGFIFLVLQRGCINNRCWVSVEGMTYLLDTQGIHAFSGGNDTQPLSHMVQDLFRFSDSPYRVNWAASQYFHAVHFPQQETIRFFVVMQGSYLPYHCIALNYREKRWWIEQYSRPVGDSVLGYLNGAPQMYAGSDAKRVLALWQGTLDGPNPQGYTVAGTVGSATLLSLTDLGAQFPPAGVVGHPVVLTGGRGKGQVRRIAAATATTLTLKDPWTVLPDATSTYQVGGVVWQYRTGTFTYVESEASDTRRLVLFYEPCVTAPCTLAVRLYEDQSATPTVWGYSLSAADGQGIQTTAGSADMLLDLTKANGFAARRLERHREQYSDGLHFVAIELAGVSNQDPVVIFQIELDGAFA
jgi:hypothetical protein